MIITCLALIRGDRRDPEVGGTTSSPHPGSPHPRSPLSPFVLPPPHSFPSLPPPSAPSQPQSRQLSLGGSGKVGRGIQNTRLATDPSHGPWPWCHQNKVDIWTCKHPTSAPSHSVLNMETERRGMTRYHPASLNNDNTEHLHGPDTMSLLGPH